MQLSEKLLNKFWVFIVASFYMFFKGCRYQEWWWRHPKQYTANTIITHSELWSSFPKWFHFHFHTIDIVQSPYAQLSKKLWKGLLYVSNITILFARTCKMTEGNGSNVNEGPGYKQSFNGGPSFLNCCQTQYAL